jgi:hypothetical protein
MKIDEIPYITHVPRDGRQLMLQPWYDNSSREWHWYAEHKQDAFVRMMIAGFSSGAYYALSAASETDLEFPIGSFVAQHLSFPSVMHFYHAIEHDVLLLSATLEKIEQFQSGTERVLSLYLVETELEYIFTLLRSMYDVLQGVLKTICARVIYPDGSRVTEYLPSSFKRIVLAGSTLRTEMDIQDRFRVPYPLAAFYVRHAPMFAAVRTIRINLVHNGMQLPSMFPMDSGFGISSDGSEAWKTLGVWGLHELQLNGIGSVRALVSYLALSILRAIQDACLAIKEIVAPDRLPCEVSESNRIFLTSPTIHRLSNLEKVLRDPWRG